MNRPETIPYASDCRLPHGGDDGLIISQFQLRYFAYTRIIDVAMREVVHQVADRFETQTLEIGNVLFGDSTQPIHFVVQRCGRRSYATAQGPGGRVGLGSL